MDKLRKLRMIGIMSLTLRFHDFRFLSYEILRSSFFFAQGERKVLGDIHLNRPLQNSLTQKGICLI